MVCLKYVTIRRLFHVLVVAVGVVIALLFVTLLLRPSSFDGIKEVLFFKCISDCFHSSSSKTLESQLNLDKYPSSFAPEVNGHFLPEGELLSLPEAIDENGLAFANVSRMVLLGDTNVFPLGSEVKVRVDVHTRRGEQKRQGGDGVRVWLRDRGSNASAAGYVIDLRNGSYLGVLRAVWSGKAEVVAAIATPQEQIQLMYRLYASRGTLRELFGVFAENATGRVENTWCFPFYPNTTALKGEVCNLTEKNHGVTWYCRRPLTLTCGHFRDFVERKFGPLPLSPLHLAMPPYFHTPLNHTVNITVKSDTGESVVRATTPCHQRPWAASFLDTTPVGFFFRGTWHLRHCDVTARTPLRAYSPCLQNKTLYLFGDSTMRQVFEHLLVSLNLTRVTPTRTRAMRNLPATAVKREWGFTMYDLIHGLPYYGGYGEPLEFHLDAIPGDTRGVVLIVLYQHFTCYHPRVFRTRLKTVVSALEGLLTRAPGVVVAIRGSHQFSRRLLYDAPFSHDDHWGKMYDRMWKEELFRLKDRVVFLDTWDMTVGEENLECHPLPRFQDALLQTLFAYVCDEQ